MSPTKKEIHTTDIEENGDDETVHQTYEEKVMNSTGNIKRVRRRYPEFTAVIMAAGYGSRLFELTNSMPKCMIPLANVPMIWYPVNLLVNNNFDEIYIIVRNKEKDQIESFLTSQFRQTNIDIHFMSIDDESEFGTADSLRLLLPKTKTDLLVLSCDLVTNISLHNLANVHRANNAAITCLVSPRSDSIQGKIVDERDFIGLDPSDDRMIFVANEKDIEDEICIQRGQLSKFPHMRLFTNLIDCHLYLVSHSALDILHTHPSISMMKCELLPKLVGKQIKQIVTHESYSDRIYTKNEYIDEDSRHLNDYYFDILKEPKCIGCFVYKTPEFCIRVNSIHNYTLCNRAVAENMEAVMPKTDLSTCDINKMTQIGVSSRVGTNVSIDAKCSVKRSMVGKGTKIGPHCKIVDSVIMNDVVIEDNVSLVNCIVCANATIRSKASLKSCRIGDKFDVPTGAEFTKEILVVGDEMSFNISNSNEQNSDDSCNSK